MDIEIVKQKVGNFQPTERRGYVTSYVLPALTPATEVQMKTVKVTVVRMSGEEILRETEVSVNDQVSVLLQMVDDALRPGRQRVWRMLANGKELVAGTTIETSGLVDGDTATVLTRQKPEPRVLQNDGATAELKADGSVAVWGRPSHGGDCSKVQNQLAADVESIFSTETAFVALKLDGSAVAWGSENHARVPLDCSKVEDQLTRDVLSVCSTKLAFAALKTDGMVVAWGSRNAGGDCSQVQAQLAKNAHSLYSTSRAFAALKEDGSVVAWGMSRDHQSIVVDAGDCGTVQHQLTVDVQCIYSTSHAFAALKADGTVVTWGDQVVYGGSGDCSEVQTQLTGVQSICCTKYAFAALKGDGHVVSWGCAGFSGGRPVELGYKKVQGQLHDVQSIYSAGHAFSALKADGTLVAWGDLKAQAEAVSEPQAKAQAEAAPEPRAKIQCRKVAQSASVNDGAIAALNERTNSSGDKGL